MMQLTLGIVSEALFGADLTAEASRIGDALTEALGAFRSLSLPLGGLLLALPLPRARRFRTARAELEAAVASLVARHRGSGHEDLLGTLLEAREAGVFDDRAVRDEVMTLLLAGHETTALALTWAFHLLATHPDVERLLHAELDRVLGNRLPTAEDLEALPVTRGVVGESLRLFPPAWVIGRRVLEPLPLTDGTVLPAGTIAVLCPWVLHRDARFWPESRARGPRAVGRRGPRGPPSPCLHRLRRRNARLHWRGLRLERGDGRPRHPRQPVALRPRPPRPGGARAERHPAASGRATGPGRTRPHRMR